MDQQFTSGDQVRSCLVASGGLLSSGMTVAFPSIYRKQNVLTEVSWLGSASHLAMIGGSLLVGPMMEKFGRKIGLIIALAFAFSGWTVMGSSGWLVPGRLLTGLSAGLASAPVSVLVAEISSPNLRAQLTTYKHSAFSLGLFIMYCFGLIFKDRWELSSLVCGGVSLLSMLAVVAWVPETRQNSTPSTSSSYLEFFKALFRRKDISSPFILMTTLSALKQLSGTTVVLSYAAQFLTAGGEKDAELGAVCLGGVRLAASLFAAPLAVKFGRRALASVSGALSTWALLIIAGGYKESLLCFLLFVFCSALSSSAIQAYIGEVFPSDFRAVCTGLTTTIAYASAFTVLHCHPWLQSRLGFQRLLGVYATISTITTIVILCFLHEISSSDKGEESTKPEEKDVTVPLREEDKEITTIV